MRTLIIFIFFYNILLAGNIYIPKNEYEKITLDKYRRKEINLILNTHQDRKDPVLNNAVNEKIVELFKDYLRINIKIKYYSFNEFGDIEGIFATVLENKRNENFLKLSNYIFSHNLYIASNKINVDSLDDINGKRVYTTEKSKYLDYFKFYLQDKNVDYNPIKVKSKDKYSDELVLVTSSDSFKYKYKYKIGPLPNISIGVSEEYYDLLPIINEALKEKYKDIIYLTVEKKKDSIFNENFLNLLTDIEKEQLKNLNSSTITFDVEERTKYFSKERTEYIGVVPFMVDKIKDRYGINFRVDTDNNEYRTKKYEDFEKKKLRVIPLAKTPERLNKFIFTDEISTSKFYVMINDNSKSEKIGVIDNSYEEYNVNLFHNKEKIVKYQAESYLINDIKLGKISKGYLLNADRYNLNGIHLIKINTIPIFLALHQEDKILKDILNKGLSIFYDINILTDRLKMIEQRDAIRAFHKNKIHNYSLIIFISTLMVTILISIYKMLLHKKIATQLEKDPLTQLQNRGKFNKFIASNKNTQGIAIFIDVDNFKSINDIYGHYRGDETIVIIANFIREIFGEESSYRISGDEFYVLTNNKDFIDKILILKEKMRYFKADSKCHISLSIGYYINEKMLPLEKAFKYADMAMYEAKKITGFSFLEATDELIIKKQREYIIKQRLRERCIDGMHSVFQPKFDLNSMKIIGMEALARWSTNDLGKIFPDEFIPLAEITKNIHVVDFKIAEEAMIFIKKLKKEKLVDDNFKISFNISMETFERDDVIDTINDLLTIHNIPGEWLEVEVTETILSSNLNKTISKLNKLRELKIQISIDDFIAGHSSVNLLTVLPIDVVKIDKSILDGVCSGNYNSHSIYKNLIQLINDLNLKIVSEGIETQCQLDFLKENGVEIGQGFIFSRPLDKNESLNFIKNNN
nr:EAL domain-containing protein [uncultured Cetobacterium sp.]